MQVTVIEKPDLPAKFFQEPSHIGISFTQKDKAYCGAKIDLNDPCAHHIIISTRGTCVCGRDLCAECVERYQEKRAGR